MAKAISKLWTNVTLGLLFLLPAKELLAAEPLWKEVGTWQVRVDRSLGGGCFIFNVYDTGTMFRVGFNPTNDNGYVLLGNESWKSLEEGKDYKIQYQFDDAAPWNAIATGQKIEGGSVVFLAAEFTQLKWMEEMARKQRVVIRYNGRTIATLSLRGSFAAFAEMLRCQQAMGVIPPSQNRQPRDPFVAPGPSARDPFGSSF